MFDKKAYMKEWNKNNPEKLKKYRENFYEEHKEKVKEWNKKWHAEHKIEMKECRREYYINNREEFSERGKKYYKENIEKLSQKRKIKTRKVRVAVLNIISGGNPHCVRCGCDDIRLLEINHKNGGGGQEKQKTSPGTFHWNIYTGKRKTDDLEVLCKVCNAWHYLELKYGKLPYGVSFKN